MSRDQRKAIVYSLIFTYGKINLDLVIEVSGIPRSTFYKLMAEVESETGFETGFSGHSPAPSEYLRQVLRLDPPETPKLRQFNHGSSPNEHKDSSSFPQPKRDLQTYISMSPLVQREEVSAKSQKKWADLPVRSRKYNKPNGQLVSYFSQRVFEIRGKEVRFPRGDIRAAMRQARAIVDRGYSLDEGKGTVDFYVALGRSVKVSDREREWIDGYPWAKFISGFDELYDRGVRTDRIVIPDPEVDHLILDWLGRIEGARRSGSSPMRRRTGSRSAGIRRGGGLSGSGSQS